MSEDTMELRLLMPESARVSQTTISTGFDIAQYRSSAGRAGDSDDPAADGNDNDVSRHVSWNGMPIGLTFLNHAEHDTNVKHKSSHTTQTDGEEERAQTKLYVASAASHTYRRITHLWWLELLACAFSLACFVAIAGVLVYEDGKPLARWKLVINPTALVSFIGVLGKSSSLLALTEVISHFKWLHYQIAPHRLRVFEIFDNASRGPLGASRLLRTLRWNSWLASAAALLVLLSLVVSPFIQLVFRFPTRTLRSEFEQANFKTATIYNPTHFRFDGFINSIGGHHVDLSMQSAILRAIYSSPMAQDVTCSSGNCTISSATTLAVCSTCDNLTEQVTTSCTDQQWTPSGRAQYSVCNYSLPYSSPDGTAKLPLVGGWREETIVGLTELGPNSLKVNSYVRWNSTVFSSKIYDLPVLAHILAMQLPDSGDYRRDIKTPAIWNCILKLCEKTFPMIEVVNGAVVPSSPIERHFSPGNAGDAENFTLDSESFSQLLLDDNNQTRYSINIVDLANIRWYLNSLLRIGWWHNATFASTRPAWTNPGSLGYYENTTPDTGRALAHAKTIPKLFDMIAGNMTEDIRRRGVFDMNDTVNQEPGVAYRTESYIEVRWAYLAFPFTLATMTAVLLAIAIALTERSNVPAWRSSSLAVLFHGLHGWNMDGRIATNPGELEATAKLMRAKLSKDEWPPAFVKAD